MEEQVTKRWHLGLFLDLPPMRLSANGNVGTDFSNFFWIFLTLSLSFLRIFPKFSDDDVTRPLSLSPTYFSANGTPSLPLSLSNLAIKKFNPSGTLTIFGLFKFTGRPLRWLSRQDILWGHLFRWYIFTPILKVSPTLLWQTDTRRSCILV